VFLLSFAEYRSVLLVLCDLLRFLCALCGQKLLTSKIAKKNRKGRGEIKVAPPSCDRAVTSWCIPQ